MTSVVSPFVLPTTDDADDARAVCEVIEANLWSMWAQFGRFPGGTLHDEPHALWFETPMPVPPYNMVVRFQADEGEAVTAVDAIFTHFTRRHVPFLWLLHPSARPAGLADLLRARGFEEVEPITGMVAALRAVAEPPPAPSGLEVQEVRGDAQVALYMRAVAARWQVPEEAQASHAAIGVSARIGEEGSPNRAWLALRGGTPIAKAFTHDAAGVVGLYGMATVPEARGLGLGRLLALTALDAARRRGLETAILHATPMALGLYTALGFREACRFSLCAAPGSFYA